MSAPIELATRARGLQFAHVQILDHTKIENAVWFLGVDVEDMLTLAEGAEV